MGGGPNSLGIMVGASEYEHDEFQPIVSNWAQHLRGPTLGQSSLICNFKLKCVSVHLAD